MNGSARKAVALMAVGLVGLLGFGLGAWMRLDSVLSFFWIIFMAVGFLAGLFILVALATD